MKTSPPTSCYTLMVPDPPQGPAPQQLTLKDQVGLIGGLGAIAFAYGWVLLSRFYGYFGITPEQAGVSNTWVVTRVAVLLGPVGLAAVYFASLTDKHSPTRMSLEAVLSVGAPILFTALVVTEAPLTVALLFALYASLLAGGLFWVAVVVFKNAPWRVGVGVAAVLLYACFVVGAQVGKWAARSVADGSLIAVEPFIAHERAILISVAAETGLKPGMCVVVLGESNSALYVYAREIDRTVRVNGDAVILSFQPGRGCDIGT